MMPPVILQPIGAEDDHTMITQWIGIASVVLGVALVHWADRVRP
jgi:hypothetical protein